MKTAYIFHVHNTFEEYHINMAFDSILNQIHTTLPMDTFYLWNVSDNFVSEDLLERARVILDGRFKRFVIPSGIENQGSVRTDVNQHLELIQHHDWYFLHKADFYLPVWTWNHFQTYIQNRFNPVFVNFAKFDCRETAKGQRIKDLANAESFEHACTLDGVWRDFYDRDVNGDIPLDHDAIGYRGTDGIMHFYNEDARKLLKFESFINPTTWNQNRLKGIEMYHGLNDFFVYHMYHALDRGNKFKRIEGYRF